MSAFLHKFFKNSSRNSDKQFKSYLNLVISTTDRNNRLPYVNLVDIKRKRTKNRPYVTVKNTLGLSLTEVKYDFLGLRTYVMNACNKETAFQQGLNIT